MLISNATQCQLLTLATASFDIHYLGLIISLLLLLLVDFVLQDRVDSVLSSLLLLLLLLLFLKFLECQVFFGPSKYQANVSNYLVTYINLYYFAFTLNKQNLLTLPPPSISIKLCKPQQFLCLKISIYPKLCIPIKILYLLLKIATPSIGRIFSFGIYIDNLTLFVVFVIKPL